MAEEQVNLSQILDMLKRMEESNIRLEEASKQNAIKLDETSKETNSKLDETRSEINNKIDDIKLHLTIQLNDTNFKLDQSIDKINDQLKEVVDTVVNIDSRVTAMETKIDDLCKALESTLIKAFTEQVTSMNTKMRKPFTNCETQINVINTEHVKLEAVVTQNKHNINRLETVVKDNEAETLQQTDKIKTIDERFEQLKKEFKARSSPAIVYQGHTDDKERVTFRGSSN